MAAPLDRIRRKLGPDQAAKFDRALDKLADAIEAIVDAQANARPKFVPRFHKGELLDTDVVKRDTVA